MKPRTYILLATCLLRSFAIQAQHVDSIKVIGQVTGDNGVPPVTYLTKAYLNPVNPEEPYFSATVDSLGSFTIKVPVQVPTLYILKYRDYKMEVLLSPKEPIFKISIEADMRRVRNMRAVDSHEYDAFRLFKKINFAFTDKLGGLIAGDRKELRKEIDELNKQLNELSSKYKGTYAASVLAPMAKMPEINTAAPALPQLQEHFFDHADLADTTLYRTLEFSKQLATYLDKVADTSAARSDAFIEGFMNRVNSNVRAEKDLLLLLFNNFTDGGRENFLASLEQWGAKQKSLAQRQPLIAAKLKSLAQTLPGAKAAEVGGNDMNGQALLLSGTIAKNKLTLLVFWSPDCSHCKKQIPELLPLYQKYHNKGLEIFAAVWADEDGWKQFVSSHQLPWQNIKLNEYNTVHSDYYITSTPTYVIINNSGVILRRFIAFEDLEGIISGALDK